MKAFCITLNKMPRSVELSERCIKSGEKFGIAIEAFNAIDRYKSKETMINEGLKWGWTRSLPLSDIPSVIGCFMSHYLIWKKCIRLNSEVLILEHDAVIIQAIPRLDYTDAIHIAKLGWGLEPDYEFQKTYAGIYPLYTKQFKGTFGYLIKPKAAQIFLKAARKVGVWPVDEFLNTRLFPFLQQLNPGLIVHENDFSCIQKYPGMMTLEQVWRDYAS